LESFDDPATPTAASSARGLAFGSAVAVAL